MSVLECTAEKERDVFNVGLYTVNIDWKGDISLEVNSRKGKNVSVGEYSWEGEGCLN
jgi:hypothetical protein